ncbi:MULTISPECIES: flagellar basal body-associated protein FliL [Methylobacillus]|uniref:Flagellar protein FliL n=1 Tax=Methylobacillus flagellatus (strain ATCC 51484 / DSM 6875 / VKM B-1610 / KT) TaxID=265072 RepID=Q1GZU8_METFK|nr:MULTISPECIES: flagellar basal body-associated protein FliL [Methylobacillus]ABE50239.1 flagellar basal body-associated protein FliL [Methylobacillus flagellatus KT]MPS48420.1 flagellar basal body-associated protein FliL [Methylobacillus sp.]
MAQQAAKQGAAKDTQQKGSKKGLILALIGGLLVAVLGAGGAYWYLKQHDGNQQDKPREEKVVAKEPVFVTLDTFTVNLQPDPDDQYLQVDLTVQVEDQAQADIIKKHMPSVRNRILILLSSKKSSELLNIDGKKALASEIIAQLSEPFSPGAKPQAVSDVFFTSFVIQ